MAGKEMKQKDFKPCIVCGKGVMHANQPIFLRVTVERLGIDIKAVQRAYGAELMMGNHVIANAMGLDEDLAKIIDASTDMLICSRCAGQPLPPYFWLNEKKENDHD